jgi:hypothetical protein
MTIVSSWDLRLLLLLCKTIVDNELVPTNPAEQNLVRFPSRASDEFEAKRPPAFPPTFLYSLSWEDPREDDKVLDINGDDTVLTLTSGGCNALDLVYQVVLKLICSIFCLHHCVGFACRPFYMSSMGTFHN